MSRLSIKWKIILLVLLGPVVVGLILAVQAVVQSRQDNLESVVADSRSIVLMAEAARNEMARKLEDGVIKPFDQLDKDKLLKAVPILSAIDIAKENAKALGFEFRVPKINPRNPKNEPDTLERQTLQDFEHGGMEQKVVVGEDSIRYMRPIRLTKECLFCHGSPAGSKDVLGGTKEGWQTGEVHGSFEIIYSLSRFKEEAARRVLFQTAVTVGVLSLIVLGAWLILKRSILTPLRGVVERVTSASALLSDRIGQSSVGAEDEAERISQTAAAMEQMNASVQEVARSASEAARTSDMVKIKAQEGADIAELAVKGIGEVQAEALELKENMADLGRQVESIGQVMDMISGIANQTNLLALNAAIEAARAGEAGRGFAVVAGEVRNLAEKTMAQTRKVGEAITGIQQGTKKNIVNVERTVDRIAEATGLIGKSGEALQEIASYVDMATQQAQIIAAASEEQSSASQEINRSVDEINRISVDTLEAMRQSAEAVRSLTEQAEVVRAIIGEKPMGLAALPEGGES